MLVAIHQPNFFPWLGYFDKIARADVFCWLDDVQFPKTGGTWVNRVRLLNGGKPAWVTAPVDRSYHGVRTIAEIRTRSDEPWRERLLKTLRSTYGKAPHFRELLGFLEPLIVNPCDQIADYNAAVIRELCIALGLGAKRCVRASTLEVDGKASERLVKLVRALNGTGYLCGGGAADYQEDDLFASAGVKVIYQNFSHPRYAQAGTAEFVPGLSILDALMNLGFSGTASLIQHRSAAA